MGYLGYNPQHYIKKTLKVRSTIGTTKELSKAKHCTTLPQCNPENMLRQPTGQSLSNVRTQQTKISIGPILFLYYEESLVSSNLNSKVRFYGAYPTYIYTSLGDKDLHYHKYHK